MGFSQYLYAWDTGNQQIAVAVGGSLGFRFDDYLLFILTRAPVTEMDSPVFTDLTPASMSIVGFSSCLGGTALHAYHAAHARKTHRHEQYAPAQ
jgi:hypothetical protein